MSLKKWILGAIAFFLGFTIVLSFQIKKPSKDRDTRDVWQLRRDLSNEKTRTQQLNDKRREVDALIQDYNVEKEQKRIEAMKNQLDQFRKEAGLMEISGQGIELTIEPLLDRAHHDEYHPVTAELLGRLLNELAVFAIKGISIAGERVIATTPIRDVGGSVYVNDRRLPDVPFQIKIVAKNAKKLQDEMVVSVSTKEFAEAGLRLISKEKKKITLPAYTQPIVVQHMKTVEEGS